MNQAVNKTLDWTNRGQAYYYYNKETGKIIGKVSNLPIQDIYIALVYTGQYTFTIDDERHLGQYVNLEHAKGAVTHFWDIQNRTLLEN